MIHHGPQTPLMHMAVDQVSAEAVAEGRRAPTLRFWEWAAPAVITGSPVGAQRG
ncbi:hypothetical protein ACWDKQ_21720 [Saccharopolyspora sp. NPDC000995]